MIGFDCFIVLLTIVSLLLCIRSMWYEHRLCQEVRLFYSLHQRQEPPLTWRDLYIFYSIWYILMIITDLLVLPGSIIKITILFKVTDLNSE